MALVRSGFLVTRGTLTPPVHRKYTRDTAGKARSWGTAIVSRLLRRVGPGGGLTPRGVAPDVIARWPAVSEPVVDSTAPGVLRSNPASETILRWPASVSSA